MNKIISTAALVVFLTARLVAEFPSPGSFVSEAKTSRRVFALTFDDGPGDYTPAILSALERRGAKATFFVMGSQIKGREEILGKISSSGHEIANHTYAHVNFYSYKKADREAVLRNEIEKTDKTIERVVGRRTRLLRMPHGYCAKWSREVARETGHVMVNWSRGYDWMGLSPSETARKYAEAVAPGAILLFHDGGRNRKKTLDALDATLEKASAEGYEAVTVGELISMPR